MAIILLTSCFLKQGVQRPLTITQTVYLRIVVSGVVFTVVDEVTEAWCASSIGLVREKGLNSTTLPGSSSRYGVQKASVVQEIRPGKRAARQGLIGLTPRVAI